MAVRPGQLHSDDGSSLSFNSIMTDQHGDHHGYMVLRIPSGKLMKGKPLRIKVTGSESHLTSWYMTYKQQVKTGVPSIRFLLSLKKTMHIFSSLRRQYSISAKRLTVKSMLITNWLPAHTSNSDTILLISDFHRFRNLLR